MPSPAFHRRDFTAAQHELFDRILERVDRDLPGALGLAVTVHDRRQDRRQERSQDRSQERSQDRSQDRSRDKAHQAPAVLAAWGLAHDLAHDFVDGQTGGLGGPLVDAVEHQVPVLSPDLWSDDRWPSLTRQALLERSVEQAESWARIRGVVAVPGSVRTAQTPALTPALTCLLDRPAGADTVITLLGYEQLITAATMTAGAQDSSEVADMLAVLQSRTTIEQAKGAIMGLLRCDADSAWSTLRQASHESNVKLRVLAVALVEHISGSPAEQPATGAPIIADEPARRAAALLWAVLSHEAASPNPADNT